ncbi:MAG: hypothetical protein LBG95_02210 [Treponema sp.]|jgi:hypothetical protein|nr:hypothetical protein [Treponema sp.]
MTKISRRALVVFSLLLLFPSVLRALDFGLVLNPNAGLDGSGAEVAFDAVEGTGTFVPRLSAPLGNSGDLIITFCAAANYENKEFAVFPEILQTRIFLHSGSLKITAGRMPYADPLNCAFNGLFDGLQFSLDTFGGTFSAGVWYTGYLYKKRAYISMTPGDEASYSSAVDYDDFLGTYFSSRRVLAALGWEHPALGERLRIRVSVSGEYDLNDADELCHSLYMSAKLSMPAKWFTFELGGCAQPMEFADEFRIGYAGELGFSFTGYSPFLSRLSINGRFSSGQTDMTDVFLPLTTITLGNVLKAKSSGLSIISLDYTARLHQTFSVSLTGLYFIRNDLGTYDGYPAGGLDSDGYFLGAEFFGRLMWTPVSDLRFSLGGGAFLPVLGDAAPEADLRWRVELSMIIALF